MISFPCSHCGKPLRVKEEHAGKQARCPACGRTFTVSLPDDAAGFEAIEHDAEPDAELTDSVEPGLVDASHPEAASEAKPLKKKKRRRKERPAREVPDWAWAAGGCLLAAVVPVVVLIAIGLSGHFALAAGLGAALVVAVPVGLFTLIVSMFIASAVGGGIDFGDVRVTVPKAIALLTVVCFIDFIPFIGWFIAIPIWFAGLMNLFSLDFWETRVLFIINWGTSTLFKIFVLALIVGAVGNAFDGGKDGGKKVEQPEPVILRPFADARKAAALNDLAGKPGKAGEPRPQPPTPPGPAPIVVVEKGRQPSAWPASTPVRALHPLPAPSTKSMQGAVLQFCRGGSALAVGGFDPGLVIWDVNTRKELARVPAVPGCAVGGGIIDPTGTWVFAPSDTVGRSPPLLIEVAGGRRRLKMPTSSVPAGSAFGPDGRSLFASIPLHDLLRYDLDKLKDGADTVGPDQEGARAQHPHKPGYVIAVSGDGTRLASLGRQDDNLQVWDAMSLQPVRTWKALPAAMVSLSHDGKAAAVVTLHRPAVTVSVLDVERGGRLAALEGHSCEDRESVDALVLRFSADGRSLLVAGPPGTDGRPNIARWDIATGKVEAQFTGPTAPTALAVSPDLRRLAARHADGSLTLWGFEPEN